MKLLVLGATGGIGLEIVKQAIERKHSVTAFARSPQPLESLSRQIDVVEGDLLQARSLARVLDGQNAVLSAFGPRDPKSHDRLLAQFALTLTSAMRQSSVRRVVLVSVAFLFKNALIPPAYIAGRLLLPRHVDDAAEMERIVEQSDLDWTVVRPPALTNKPRSAAYRALEDHLPLFGFSISRADVAHFMLDAVENRDFFGKIVGISN
jgi:putative NADH-flavin reductase